MSKFVLPAKKRRLSENPRGEVIRINMEAYNLLAEMANDSTLPIGKIAAEAIKYAYDNLAYEEDEE